MLRDKYYVLFTVYILSTLEASNGLVYAKQRFNPSTDFLAHEAGISAWPRKDSVTLTNSDYNAQFPSLGSHASAQPSIKSAATTNSNPSSGKRDYVSPTHTPQNSGNRDFVAAHHTTPKPQPPINGDSTASKHTTQRPQSTVKRDYVAPQFTTQKPVSGNSGKVKDLINFYDTQSTTQNGPQKVPSYSSVVQGNNNSGTSIHLSTSVTPSTPTTPRSFSSIVGVSKKPTPAAPSNHNNAPVRPTVQVNTTPTSKPGAQVLPSSLANTNRNGNQGGSGSSSPSDTELQSLSEELLRKDSNNAAKYITVNYQEKTTSQSKDDKAPQPLMTVNPEAWNIPTIQKFIPLLDNYERDTMVNEYVTPQERNEENAFMDAIMNTAVIRHLMNFLKDRGYVTPDPKQQRDFLKQLWFTLYSRGKGKISSSGFEHIFVSEIRNGDVLGLHNWIYFAREETASRANYLGYMKYQKFDDKGVVMKLHFTQQGVDKPVNTMFIGTSPELEIALYTLCFVTRADNECNIKLGSKDVNIVTHTFRYRSKNYIGSAYPQI